MGKQTDHGLTDRQLALIRRILAPFADRIKRVDLFGSRAQGKHSPDSDIDLVIHGDVDAKTADRIWTLFAESSLPLKIDVLIYDQIRKKALKAHIDLVGLSLFTQKALLQENRDNDDSPSRSGRPYGGTDSRP